MFAYGGLGAEYWISCAFTSEGHRFYMLLFLWDLVIRGLCRISKVDTGDVFMLLGDVIVKMGGTAFDKETWFRVGDVPHTVAV